MSGGGGGSSSEYEQQLMSYSAYRWHKTLMIYLPPIIIAVGTVGNVLSVVTLTRKPMRRYSTFSYLAVLAIADTVVIYVGLCRLWLAELTGIDVRDVSDVTCKIVQFCNFTASDYSGWLIVAVTVERWLAVSRPLSAPRFCSRARACKAAVILLLALSSVNVHFFWTVRIVHFRQHDGSVVPSCYYADDAIELAWPWVDALLYSLIPSLAIISLNALIVRQVIRAKRERVKLRAEGIRTIPPPPPSPASFTLTDRWRVRSPSSLSAPSTPNIAVGGTPSHNTVAASQSVNGSSHYVYGLGSGRACYQGSGASWGILGAGQGAWQETGSLPPPSAVAALTEDSGRITAMLLAVSFAFLICTLPINVALIASRLLPVSNATARVDSFTSTAATASPAAMDDEHLAQAVTFRLVRTPLELLMYVNHAINFYLYVASGSRFRAHVLWMLRRVMRQHRRRSGERSSGGEGFGLGAGGGQRGAERCSLVWPFIHTPLKQQPISILPLSDSVLFDQSSLRHASFNEPSCKAVDPNGNGTLLNQQLSSARHQRSNRLRNDGVIEDQLPHHKQQQQQQQQQQQLLTVPECQSRRCSF